jgi:uncharacterized protein YegL/bifunctional DNA-binding transcriptional regulator/antitoxin component of YhaV-PrlF toxin-antitoxin module
VGIFKKKDENRDEEGLKNLPTDIFLNPGLKVLEGFKSDKDIPEPVIRLTKYMREKFGLKAGDTVVVRKDDKLVKARVEVSSASDREERICRLNRAARDLLQVHVGAEIEIIPPETLLLLIDTSGSMGDFVTGIMKMDATRNAVREFIRSKFLMSEGDKIGIVSFGQFATVVERPTTNYEYLENRANILMPNGATAMHEGMSLAIDVLSFSEGAKRIVMLTDGVPTTTGKMAIISLAKTAAEKHIVIDTVGVGSPFDLMGYDEMLLKRIAAITGGTFRRVLDIQELTGQFRELATGKNYTYLLPEK